MMFYFQGKAQLQKYSFNEIDSLSKTNKKSIVIFIHTDWCRYCAMMKNSSFKNDSVIKILNDQFYFIELNAEERNNINFNDKTYHYKPNGNNTGTHELAEELATINGKIAYPTLCILDNKKKIIFQYNSFLSGEDFLKILSQLTP